MPRKCHFQAGHVVKVEVAGCTGGILSPARMRLCSWVLAGRRPRVNRHGRDPWSASRDASTHDPADTAGSKHGLLFARVIVIIRIADGIHMYLPVVTMEAARPAAPVSTSPPTLPSQSYPSSCYMQSCSASSVLHTQGLSRSSFSHAVLRGDRFVAPPLSVTRSLSPGHASSLLFELTKPRSCWQAPLPPSADSLINSCPDGLCSSPGGGRSHNFSSGDGAGAG